MRGFTLLGKELSAIVTNKKLLISVMAVLFIPILYSGMFLWAFWDPYKSLDELPVAVVNNDKGAIYEGEQLKIGEDFVDKLKESSNFKWDFVSEKQGSEGLKNRKYYMMVRIPENFSSNATTLLDEKPKHLELEYIPNESYNFLSSQMGNTAMEKIKGEISATLTETYAEQMFDSIKEVSNGLAQAGDGATKLNEGSADAEAGAEQIRDNLKILAEKSIAFKNGLNDASEGSFKVENGLNDLSSGIGQLYNAQGQLYQGGEEIQGGLQELQSKMPMLVNGSQNLKNGADQLATGVAEWKAGAVSTNEGAKRVVIGAKELQEQLQPILGSSILTEEQKEALQKGLDELVAGSQQVADGTDLLAQKAEDINMGVSQLSQGVSQLNAGQVQAAGGISQLEQGQTEFLRNFQVFGSKLGEAQNGAKQLTDGSAALLSGLGQLSTGSIQMVEGVGKLAEGSSQLTDGIGQINDGTGELANKLNEAAQETGEVKGNKDKYNMLAQPVEIKTNKVAPVPNYGTGITPYFLSIGLFVGALVTSIVFPLRETVGAPKSGFSWFVSKYGVLLGIGLLQSLIADIILLMVLGINVESVSLFMLFSFITSVTFLTLVQFLVTAFGDVGRFLAIITLVLQLSTSAGTFPLELIPKSLQIFHGWLPMAYSVSGFKAVISSGDFSFMWENIGVLLVFIAAMALATIITFTIFHKRYSSYNIKQGTTAEM
ncbi:YhgE/Pip domain-containing protein [Bacillus sp. 165]|uniref:YhgE/Pip domain-containing protein n=1 Tax=Bacillus sp. 165 TaxID=1529117 RepID=UPI001ADC5097|nr:YhgE/Pip domain-containing protein [Bacillus sp. 165]MBO9128717.1 YhgE/Pip domain-containing protein [Bacillus sp. 165]